MKSEDVNVGEYVNIKVIVKVKDEVSEIFQKALVHTVYYFENTATVGYYNLTTKGYEYKKMEFDNLYQIQPPSTLS